MAACGGDARLAIDALRIARLKRYPDKYPGLIFNSDCVSQDASVDFRNVLNRV